MRLPYGLISMSGRFFGQLHKQRVADKTISLVCLCIVDAVHLRADLTRKRYAVQLIRLDVVHPDSVCDLAQLSVPRTGAKIS